MKRREIKDLGSIMVNNSSEGETIENKIRRIVNNKEPITDGAPIIYTERKQGVLPAYNIRTDRFDVALGAMDVVYRAGVAKREEAAKVKAEKGSSESSSSESSSSNESSADRA